MAARNAVSTILMKIALADFLRAIIEVLNLECHYVGWIEKDSIQTVVDWAGGGSVGL